MSDDARIESVLHENRLFPPPEGIAERLGGALVANLDQWQNSMSTRVGSVVVLGRSRLRILVGGTLGHRRSRGDARHQMVRRWENQCLLQLR